MPYDLLWSLLRLILQALPDTESLALYQTGVRFGCWGLAVYALSCSLYSMVIENLMNLVGLVQWFNRPT